MKIKKFKRIFIFLCSIIFIITSIFTFNIKKLKANESGINLPLAEVYYIDDIVHPINDFTSLYIYIGECVFRDEYYRNLEEYEFTFDYVDFTTTGPLNAFKNVVDNYNDFDTYVICCDMETLNYNSIQENYDISFIGTIHDFLNWYYIDYSYYIGYEAGIEGGWEIGYEEGFYFGEERGQEIGYDNGYYEGHEDAYQEGFIDGENSKNNETYNFKNMLYTIIDAPISVLKNAFNFEIFGINLANLCMGLITMTFVLFVIKVFKK